MLKFSGRNAGVLGVDFRLFFIGKIGFIKFLEIKKRPHTWCRLILNEVC
jgi:hypothetical protein